MNIIFFVFSSLYMLSTGDEYINTIHNFAFRQAVPEHAEWWYTEVIPIRRLTSASSAIASPNGDFVEARKREYMRVNSISTLGFCSVEKHTLQNFSHSQLVLFRPSTRSGHGI
jgi:hypothetical protein